MSGSPTLPAPGSPEDLEAGLAAVRAALRTDVEELSYRLAPARLPGLARQTARSALSGACARLRGQGAALAQHAGIRGTVAPDPGAPPHAGPAHDAGHASARDRLARLLDDARDGDPTSLAIVSALAVALAGLSAVALVKAVTR